MDKRQFIEGIEAGAFYEGLTPPGFNPLGIQPTGQGQDETPVPVMQVPAKYYNSVVIKNQADYIESNCAEITFFNNAPTTFTGLVPDGATMIINNMSFPPGAYISFDGKAGEQDTTRYTLSFTNVGAPVAVIIRKIYL